MHTVAWRRSRRRRTPLGLRKPAELAENGEELDEMVEVAPDEVRARVSTVVDAMGKIADGDFSAATEFQCPGSRVDGGEPGRRQR